MPRRKLENKTIEVILLASDKHLGEKFEVVRVRPIFARNILLPKNIAVLADASNKNKFSQKIIAGEHDRAKKAQGLDELFMKIQQDGGVKIIRKANKDKTLYAKVDENDIVTAIKEIYGLEIESHLFKLKKKLTSIGHFNVPFLYKELKKEVGIDIQQDPEEDKKIKKSEEKHSDESTEKEEKPKKTRDQIKAEKEEERKKKKAETIKKLKEKYK